MKKLRLVCIGAMARATLDLMLFIPPRQANLLLSIRQFLRQWEVETTLHCLKTRRQEPPCILEAKLSLPADSHWVARLVTDLLIGFYGLDAEAELAFALDE